MKENIGSREVKNMYKAIFQQIENADAVVIGAGAGLSTSGGLEYAGERFERLFPDFIARYGLTDMYSSGFYPFPTNEERWAYWSRHVLSNRFEAPIGQVYKGLLDAVMGKEYFVLTTNADHQFFRAGFDSERIFATQGDYGEIQCSKGCHDVVYDNEATIYEMVERQVDCRIPSELVPKCPVCGEDMDMHLRKDDTFVEDENWHVANGRYESFLWRHQNRKLLFIELGVGMNTPGIIKYSFWRYVYQLPKARYICLNYGEAWAPKEIADRSLALNVDIKEVFN